MPLWFAPAPLLLQPETPVVASVASDGRIRVSKDGNRLFNFGLDVAKTGWSWAGLIPTGKPNEWRLNTDAGGTVNYRLVARGNELDVEIDAQTAADLGVESVNVSFSFTLDWIDALARFDADELVLPKVPGELRIYAKPNRTVTFSRPGDRIGINFGEPAQMMVQDNRRWGATFELRAWSEGRTPVWKASEPIRYRFTVKFDGKVELRQSGPLTIEAGPDWIPFTQKLDIAKGSPLDWTPKGLRPAGSRGRIIVNPAGRFAYASAPTVPLKFYGSNLCFSATVPDKETAEKLAVRLAATGHNTVRLHHYDVELTGGFGQDRAGDSTVLDPAAMDRFDYLFHQLKRNGIYTKIDLFTIRQIRRDEILPGIVGMDDFKALLLVSPKARENWWAYTRNLLGHRNRYTGLTYAEDPALAWICVVNENNIGSAYRGAGAGTKALFNEAWRAAGNQGDFTWETDAGARFAAKLHAETYRWMRDKIRSLGCRALLTDNNGWHEQTALITNRDQLDWVDNHNYWDHPNFLGSSWGLPSRGGSGGGMATQALGGGLQGMSLTRLAGKPFSVSEFQFTAPNPFRGESGLYMGALAARQDWDALWRFAWSHAEETLDKPVPFDYFNVQSDPALMATERTLVALFMRGDLPKAPALATIKLDPARVGAANYASPLTQMPFDVRVQTSTREGESDPKPMMNRMAGPVRIDPPTGVLTVVTPRTVGVFGPTGRAFRLGPVEATLQSARASFVATSVDDLPLVQSRRILLTHVTDVQNSGITFADSERDVLTNWGRIPHLVRNGSVAFTLRRPGAESLKIWRLDASGKRVAPVPVRVAKGQVSATLTVAGPQGATLYYEVATK